MKKLLSIAIIGAILLGNVTIHPVNKTTTVSRQAYIYPIVKTGIGALLIALSPAGSSPWNTLANSLRNSLISIGIGLELLRAGGKDIITLRQKEKKQLSKSELMFLKLFYPA